MEMKSIIPDELRFAITRKCDGECRHCYNLSGKNTDRLSAENFIQLIKEVHQLNPKIDRITLTGGEPLSEKEKVLDIARFASSLNLRIRLVTRGWELDRKLCYELKEAGVTRVQIGLDSSGELAFTDEHRVNWDTYHSWLRGDKSGFRKTVQAVKMAIETGLDVSIRYSLCRSNLQDVAQTYQFVSSLGVSKFKFRILFPDGRAKRKLVHELISGEDMADAQFNLIEASRGNRTVVEITQPCLFELPNRESLSGEPNLPNAFKEACPCGTTAAYVDSNGDVKYCLFDEKILGNICEDSFLDVWNSSTAREARRLRCPFDLSGNDCSSFKILYSQFNDYSTFMKTYMKGVKERIMSVNYQNS